MAGGTQHAAKARSVRRATSRRSCQCPDSYLSPLGISSSARQRHADGTLRPGTDAQERAPACTSDMATSATMLHPAKVPMTAGIVIPTPATHAIAISVAVSIAPPSADIAMVADADVIVGSAMMILLGVNKHSRADSPCLHLDDAKTGHKEGNAVPSRHSLKNMPSCPETRHRRYRTRPNLRNLANNP